MPTNCFFDNSFFRGSPSLIIEWLVAPTTGGWDEGHFLTGPSFIVRYQFQQPGYQLVPYLQIGAGIVLDDAYHDRGQGLIGGPVEFFLQAELGFSYFINPTWSLDFEAGYHHISNSGMYARNTGVNNFVLSLGATYHFGG